MQLQQWGCAMSHQSPPVKKPPLALEIEHFNEVSVFTSFGDAVGKAI